MLQKVAATHRGPKTPPPTGVWEHTHLGNFEILESRGLEMPLHAFWHQIQY